MTKKSKVGDVRPSQIMFTYGVGSIVDLPKLSVIVMGLEDWPKQHHHYHLITEDRLLSAVRFKHPNVSQLLAPPHDRQETNDPFDGREPVGVPVASFPRWMVCPSCRLLAPISTGLFELDEHPYHPERTVYRHASCTKRGKAKRAPEAVPARFLVTCPAGHLDDFPWVTFVHHDGECPKGNPTLRLREYGASGEARDLEVYCETCDSRRRLSDAFGQNKQMPMCSGRRPHLRDYDPEPCEHNAQTIILGASNMWFPMVLSTIAIPSERTMLMEYVESDWSKLQHVDDVNSIKLLQTIAQLNEKLLDRDPELIWEVVQARKTGLSTPQDHAPDLKAPEWGVFSQVDTSNNSDDFRLKPIEVNDVWANQFIEEIVLVERLREVQAMVGFTRLDAIGELTDPDPIMDIEVAPISRISPTWVPASEVRGEGIFIRFREDQIVAWEKQEAVKKREVYFLQAHRTWRANRNIENPSENFPGMRYILLHSLSHVLMRQLALESGYSAASLKERIYSRSSEQTGGPMAGILIYTAASDSEGTLGGLVHLGQPEHIVRHIKTALNQAKLCASDPICAEHLPQHATLHGAACHGCLFAPETSCERGNKYLDRSTLIETIGSASFPFFELD